MKTVTLPLEFVKEAHKAACNDWKQRIEEHVPELKKPTLEVGKWYKSTTDETRLLLATGIGNSHFSACGFSDGKWREESSGWISKNFILATEQEVETALINEAKKRDLWNNPNIKCLCLGSKNNTKGLVATYSENELWSKYGQIFKDGNWAELIENPIPKKLQKLIDEYVKEKIKEMLS